ncbi:MAG: extracellular solute-binding protein [Patescibacteria group bacterium]
MQKKLLKILAVIGGLIVVWLLLFLIFGRPKADPGKTLEFWSVFDSSEDIQPLLDDFTEETGIKVNYRNFTDLNDYRETLLIELAAGEGPDVFVIHNTWLTKYKNFLRTLPIELGYPLTNVSKDFVSVVGDTLLLKDAAGIEQLFGLPMYVDSLGLFYNKTYFRNVLTKAYAAPELTWEGVRDDSVGLTQLQPNSSTGFRLAGIALGRADNISRGVDIFYNLYHQFGGGDLLAESSSVSNKIVLAALDFLTSFSRNPLNQEYSWNTNITVDLPQQEISAFVHGRVAMILGFSYYYDQIKASLGVGDNSITLDEVGVAPLPQIGDPLLGNAKVAVADFFTLAVAKSSASPVEAWRLILELTSREAEEKYFQATKKPTSRRDLIDSERADPAVGVFVDQAVYADTLELAADTVFDSAIASVLNRISDGTLTPAAGASELTEIFKNPLVKSE